MGRDAYVYIDKKKYTRKAVEELLALMGYEKRGDIFFMGNDDEYKHFSGVRVWLEREDEELVYHVRTQAFASEYDIHEQNNTIRMLKKYCSAYFHGDEGKNRYFEEGKLTKGAESGCYFAIQKLDNSFSLLCHALNKYPQDEEGEKLMKEWSNSPTPNIFNANVYSSFLCSLIEEYFRATYISLLKDSERKEKVLKSIKISSYDLDEISKGTKTVEEACASTLSFQNIAKIVYNFKELDNKLDLGTPLKRPYRRRKMTFYQQIDNILERRHGMIHRMEFDLDYSSENLEKDIMDIKTALIRVYVYICDKYNWEPEEISI